MAFILGNTKVISVSTRDAGRAFADPSETLKLYIKASGSLSTYEYPGTLTKDSTGRYHVAVVLNRVGAWEYWAETSVNGVIVKTARQTFQVTRT